MNPTSALYQVLSRNSDTNGRPYRLVVVYDIAGIVTELYEERSSTPNAVSALHARHLRQLPTFHLTPADYNATKESFSEVLR